MTRLCLLGIFLLSALAATTFNLEDVEKVQIEFMKDLILESVEDPKALEQWVVGHFPSDKIIVKEGRLGTRYRDIEKRDGNWVQTFTFVSQAKEGEIVSVEFWYIKPQYAEQYFNDPNAYIEVHGNTPRIKTIEFERVSSKKKEL